MEMPVDFPGTLQKILLGCGILASLLKVGTDVLAGLTTKGYNFVLHSISNLSALGAPTRSFVLPLDLIYDLLMLAFSVAVWQLAGQSVPIRIAAVLIAANALISGVVETFLPMRLGQAPGTLHVALMATAMFAFVGAIALGGAGSSGWLRYLSYGIILAFIILTAIGLLFPAKNAAGKPVASIGIQERTMVAAYLLWVIALAVQQLLRQRT